MQGTGGDDLAEDLPDPRDPLANPLASLGDVDVSETQRYWRGRAASSPPVVYERVVDDEGFSHAVGKRKRSVAKVSLAAGPGGIQVNGRNYVDVFNRVEHRAQILRPLIVTGTLGRVDVDGTVTGGGNTGQAEALRHGIAKALQLFDPQHRPSLKKDGLLTRDSRVVESKKYGLKYAFASVCLTRKLRLRACEERPPILVTDFQFTYLPCPLPCTGKHERLRRGSSDSQHGNRRLPPPASERSATSIIVYPAFKDARCFRMSNIRTVPSADDDAKNSFPPAKHTSVTKLSWP